MNIKYLTFMAFLIISSALVAVIVAVPSSIMPAFAKLMLLVLAMLFDIAAFSSRYYTPFMIAFAQQRKRSITLNDESTYWLSASGDSVIRKTDNGFTATIYIAVPLYRSATEMTDEEKENFGKQVANLFTITNDPVRYTVQLNMIDKDVYMQNLKDTANKEEDELAKKIDGNEPQKEIEMEKGKIAMWRNIIDYISKTRSYELIQYATVSGAEETELDAISIAQQRAKDIIAGVSSILGVTPYIVTGNDLLKLFEPEYIIPYYTATEELSKNVMNLVP